MLVTLVVWTYSIALYYAYGLGATRLFQKILRLDHEKTYSFPITVIIGLAILTTISSYLSLAIPIGILASVILLTGGILILLLERRSISRHLQPRHFMIWSTIIVASLIVLEFSADAPSNPDTALYHAQSIRWIETYRVVPGLANLNYRLAENSSWMILNASFSFAFLGIRSLHLADSVIMLIALWYFTQGIERLLNRQPTYSAVTKTILFFFTFYIYASEASSPGTDLPASILTWVITALLIEKLETGNIKFDILTIAIFILSIFAVTVKISTLPLTIISLVIFVQAINAREYLRGLALSAMAAFILVPWFVRSVFLSGYLVFPVSQIDLFSFDWKYPKMLMDANRASIIAFARYPNNNNFTNALGLSFTKWVPLWFENLTTNRKILLFAAIFSPLGFLLFRAGRGINTPSKFISFPLLLNFGGMIFWFFTAPNFRFGYGFILALITMGLAPIFFWLLNLNIQVFAPILAVCMLLSILYQGFAHIASTDPAVLEQQIALPADYLPSRTEPCPLQNGTLYCRKNGYQCNYDPFPCIPTPRPNVEMRGSGYADGFRYLP